MAWINETGTTICLNADKTTAVPEDSPEAAWVLVGVGGWVSDEDAKLYELDAFVAAHAPPAAPAPAEEKAAEPVEDKAEAAPEATKS